MNRIAKKLVLSIVTVVLTVFALGTTTFAWFTLTNTAVVQPFQAQIVSDTGIQVALGDITANSQLADLDWRTTITTTDMDNYIENKYTGGFEFNNVTSPDGFTMLDLGGASATAGYLEINLHFRSNSTTSIKLALLELTSAPGPWQVGTPFRDSSGTLRAAGSSITVNAADAFRVSIRSQETTPLLFVYENPALNTNTVLGENTNADFTNGGIDDGVGVDGSVNYYYEINRELPAGADSVSTVDTQTSVANNTILNLTQDTAVVGDRIMPEFEYYGSIRVRIWLEGWDAEAYNSILGKTIIVRFRFTA